MHLVESFQKAMDTGLYEKNLSQSKNEPLSPLKSWAFELQFSNCSAHILQTEFLLHLNWFKPEEFHIIAEIKTNQSAWPEH